MDTSQMDADTSQTLDDSRAETMVTEDFDQEVDTFELGRSFLTLPPQILKSLDLVESDLLKLWCCCCVPAISCVFAGKGSLLKLLNRCSTPQGSRLCQQWIIHPLTDAQEIGTCCCCCCDFHCVQEPVDLLRVRREGIEWVRFRTIHFPCRWFKVSIEAYELSILGSAKELITVDINKWLRELEVDAQKADRKQRDNFLEWSNLVGLLPHSSTTAYTNKYVKLTTFAIGCRIHTG